MSLGEEGQVTVLFALAIVVLTGFSALTVDGGRLYLQHVRIQNAVDAAALAGARELPEDPATAEAVALDYLDRNGIDGSQASIEAVPASISVQVADEIQWTLARVFGSDTGSFSARAGAEVGVAGAVRGVVPMGIEKREGGYGFGNLAKLKLGQARPGCDERSYHGNFHAIAFDDEPGAHNYKNYLENGYPDFVSISETRFKTKTGVMSGPTKQGLSPRLQADPLSTYEDFAPGSPRLVYAPVVNTFDVDGSKFIEVVGFAAVFLKAVDDCGVTGWFIRYYGDAEFREYLNEEDFGLRVVKLNQ